MCKHFGFKSGIVKYIYLTQPQVRPILYKLHCPFSAKILKDCLRRDKYDFILLAPNLPNVNLECTNNYDVQGSSSLHLLWFTYTGYLQKLGKANFYKNFNSEKCNVLHIVRYVGDAKTSSDINPDNTKIR